MKSLVVCLGLVSVCALAATPASAQSSAPQQPARTKSVPGANKLPADTATVLAAVANAPAAAPAATANTANRAAGTGGNSALAQTNTPWMQAPADGFEYER